MIPLAAVCAMLVPSPAFSQAPAPYDQALAKARGAFAAQQPGQPALDAVVKLPPARGSGDPSQELARLAIEAAKDVQLGCAAPCSAPADLQVYAGKVELIARRLGMKDEQVSATLKNYIPEGKPRLRAAADGDRSPAGQALEAEVVARLLSDERLAPAVHAQLGRKALAMADALGRTGDLKADASGVVTFPDGKRARMTADQLARLNSIPQAQAQILRHLAASAPPPPLSAREKQANVLAGAEREIQSAPGTVGDAYNYWDREAKDPDSNWLWKGYAKLNKGALTFSGLKAVEESSERLGWVMDNEDVSKGEKFWLGTKLVANSALSAASFLPAASFAKSLQAGEGFYWIGKAGAAVPGAIRATAPQAAEASRSISTVIAETLPDGTKAGKDQLRALIGALNQKAARYGVRIVEGGVTGESTASGGKVLVSLDVGAQHETVHTVQQMYTRVMALEQVAAQSGTTVEALSAAQRAEAFAGAVRWETASYAQLESQAFRATGFMGNSAGAQYTRQLLLTGQEISAGMRNGEVLEGSFTLGQRFYGTLTQVLGHSQREIGVGMRAMTAGLAQAPLFDPTRQFVDGLVQPLTAPALAPRAAAPVPFAR